MERYRHYRYENDSYYRYLAVQHGIEEETIRYLNTDGVLQWLKSHNIY